MCDVIVEIFYVRFHSCKKAVEKKNLKNKISLPEYEDNVYESQKNSLKKTVDMDELN